MQGRPQFITETDKSLKDLSPRIQCLQMRLKFRFKACHIPGKELRDADSFSQEPTSTPSQKDKIAKEDVLTRVNFVFHQLPATFNCLQEIAKAVEKDKLLQSLVQYITEERPARKKDCAVSLQPYQK